MTPEERAYDVCNRIAVPGWGDDITMASATAIRAAAAEEREACAAICARCFQANESAAVARIDILDRGEK